MGKSKSELRPSWAVAKAEQDKANEQTPTPGLKNLITSLPQHRLDQLKEQWALTPNLSPKEIQRMLLEEERKFEEQHPRKLQLQSDPSRLTGLEGAMESDSEVAERMKCSTCGKTGHGDDDCWISHPENAPDWLKAKWQDKPRERQRGRGKQGSSRKPKVQVQKEESKPKKEVVGLKAVDELNEPEPEEVSALHLELKGKTQKWKQNPILC